jgi:hypothetical protein
MSSQQHIPCKRPKVLLEQPADVDLYTARCSVPGCGWIEGPSVKTYMEQRATAHRREHRHAVPKTWIERDPEYDVYCEPCGGHRRTFSTRSDAQAWLDHHLSTEHGLVAC